MNSYPFFNYKIPISLIVAFLAGVHILWDYYHGGVPIHSLLAADDLPGFSNWWGLLTLPLLTWVSITLTEKRVEKRKQLSQKPKERYSEILKGFLGSLAFGIVISVFWELGMENVLQYLILLPIAISLFIPLYSSEYLLGFVLSMVFTFGGVLPIIFGLVILLLCFIAYEVIRKGALFILSKIF